MELNRTAILGVVLVLVSLSFAACARQDNALPTRTYNSESAPQSAAAYAFLYPFANGPGANPSGTLVYDGGLLYGTTSGGGDYNAGTAFSIDTTGAETTLYSFGHCDYSTSTCDSGKYPSFPLTVLNGTLYGTTLVGDIFEDLGYGPPTIFSLSVTGVQNVINDGGWGRGPLTGYNNDLYGVNYGTQRPCQKQHHCGFLYRITPAGSITVLHSFDRRVDGETPSGALIARNGILYGTTEGGGAAGHGTVYGVTTGGRKRTIYSFLGGTDGSRPMAPLVFVGKKLYGTTAEGGHATAPCPKANGGCGTVFSVDLTGHEHVLYRFKGGSDGSVPHDGLVYISPKLFGTTTVGGQYGRGTVFSLNLKTGRERVLHSFMGGSDGDYPIGNLTLVNGVFFGVTMFGGGTGCVNQLGCGTFYSLTP